MSVVLSSIERMHNNRVEVKKLSKSFKDVSAVKNLSFVAEPGRVTGFLGPNGSGKTTTLQMILGLIKPDSGAATIGGVPYTDLDRPALQVGSSIAAVFHPSHTARAHLDIIRRAIGVSPGRVQELLNMVGLEAAADRKVGGFSLGMRQRLSLATALLGDPEVIMLDEPINGLDPEGIRWIRVFLRHLAGEGKTVLLSSHMLGEVQQTVDDVVVIREGELVFTGPLEKLYGDNFAPQVLVDSNDRVSLSGALQKAGFAVQGLRGDSPLHVLGADAETVGEIALESGVALTHLSVAQIDLEQSFLELIDRKAQVELEPRLEREAQ